MRRKASFAEPSFQTIFRSKNETAGRGEDTLVNRAQKMAQTADILIIDWFLKKRNAGTTLKIIETVLQADRAEGGRTRLICIYTGEEQLQEICGQVRDRLGGGIRSRIEGD